MRDIGRNIRAARIHRQMIQDTLAEQLHVSRQTISNYETGRSRPDIDMLLSVAETLDTDVHPLLYGLRRRRKSSGTPQMADCGHCGLVLWMFAASGAALVRQPIHALFFLRSLRCGLELSPVFWRRLAGPFFRPAAPLWAPNRFRDTG